MERGAWSLELGAWSLERIQPKTEHRSTEELVYQTTVFPRPIPHPARRFRHISKGQAFFFEFHPPAPEGMITGEQP